MYTIYANAEGFLMIHILNVCENAILMYLIPILVSVYYIYDGIVCSKIPFKAAYSVTMNIFRKNFFSFQIICKRRIKLCFHNKNVQYS